MQCDINSEIILKIRSNILRNPSNIDPKMVQHSWKIDLWSCLGALWAPSCRQDGTRSTPRAKNNEKSLILGWLMGSKMEPKSYKNLIKNHIDFYNGFETTFSRFWDDFGSKNLVNL